MNPDDERAIRPPLLYSLVDDEPESASDPRLDLRSQLDRLKESVRQDLQNLLNTRQRCVSWPRELGELDGSVLDYGIEDVTGANLSTEERRLEFLARLGRTIQRHDPRFKSVSVTALDNSDPHDRTLRFRVEATLQVETDREAAVFDFQMEPVSRRFR